MSGVPDWYVVLRELVGDEGVPDEVRDAARQATAEVDRLRVIEQQALTYLAIERTPGELRGVARRALCAALGKTP